MKTHDLSPGLMSLILLFVVTTVPIEAQNSSDEYLLKGLSLRGGKMSFSKALVMDYNESTEIWLGQSKSFWSFGVGYDYLERDSWIGCGASANYGSTNLDPFAFRLTPTSGFTYKDVSYAFLLFDADAYLVPVGSVPFAFTLGISMGTSFHGYTLSSDDPYIPVGGAKSFSIFRYGYILGCKIMPLKFISLELEYRPMGSYSSTTSYDLGDFAYSRGGYDYYYVKSSETTSGESESMFLMGLSIHF